MIYKAIIFDYDNTLVLETDYLFAQYQNIGEYLAQKYELNANEVCNFLIHRFNTIGRKRLFDFLMRKYQLPSHEKDSILSILRSQSLNDLIPLLPYRYDKLKALEAAGKQLFILTNGHSTQQKHKLKNTEWQGLNFEAIKVYFASDYEPKPSPVAMNLLLKEHDLMASEVLFVGDNANDADCAKAAGVDFMFAEAYFS